MPFLKNFRLTKVWGGACVFAKAHGMPTWSAEDVGSIVAVIKG
jgi:hypothetical protein